MTNYANWKIKKSELDEHLEEYSQVAEWCNDSGEYTITEDSRYYKVEPIPAPLPPTHEEVEQMRADAYAKEVDCITAHIQRLRDESPVPEGEIAELIAERDVKVQEIKERYPYPDGE